VDYRLPRPGSDGVTAARWLGIIKLFECLRGVEVNFLVDIVHSWARNETLQLRSEVFDVGVGKVCNDRKEAAGFPATVVSSEYSRYVRDDRLADSNEKLR
jgi:hypothetical protein